MIYATVSNYAMQLFPYFDTSASNLMLFVLIVFNRALNNSPK